MPEISGKPSPGGWNLALNLVHTFAQGVETCPRFRAYFSEVRILCPRFRAYFCPGCINVPEILGWLYPGERMKDRRMNAFKHSLLQVTLFGWWFPEVGFSCPRFWWRFFEVRKSCRGTYNPPAASAWYRGISFNINGEATGIKTIDAEHSDSWFDLQGRRVNVPTKGVYINNGRKRVIK